MKKFIDILKLIGGTPTDSWGNGKDEVNFPCAVIDSFGHRNEKAVLSFRKIIASESLKNERPISDVVEISQTYFAVPSIIRKAYHYGEETSNNFYPTAVRTPDGQDLVINGLAHILDLGICKTKDLVLSDDEGTIGKPVVRQPSDVIFFVGEWTEEIEQLRIVPQRS